jgi:hypothetical protein
VVGPELLAVGLVPRQGVLALLVGPRNAILSSIYQIVILTSIFFRGIIQE